MPDQTQAFAGLDGEIDLRQRPNGTEAFRHMFQIDDQLRCDSHAILSNPRTGILPHCAPATTFLASSSVYSVLATPPASVVARLCSSVSWSMRRNGTVRSFGTFSPFRIICATQKARVETPGAIETDMV